MNLKSLQRKCERLVENNKEDKLFGFTRDQIFEAIRKFQAMDQSQAQTFLRTNPIAKAIMMGDLGKKKENKDG